MVKLKPDFFLSSRKKDLEKVQGKAWFEFAFLFKKTKVVTVTVKINGRIIKIGNSGTEGEGVKAIVDERVGVCVGNGLEVGVGVRVGD